MPDQVSFGFSLSDPIWRLRIAFVALPGLVLFGTVGYMFLGGLDAFDALYMTLITVSTVGYGEIGDLGMTGRAFTVVLIAMGIFLVGFSTASFVEAIVDGELARYFGRRRLDRQIAELNNHWIVAGYGRMGELVEKEIRRTPNAPDVLIIDHDPQRIERCEEQRIPYVQANATTDEALQLAGIDRAAGLVSLVASDAENVFICLTARGMRPDLTIVARALEDQNEDKLRKAGANKVISPYLVGGQRLSMAVLRPAVAQFMDFASNRLHLEIDEAEVRPGAKLIGTKLRDSGLRGHLDLIVLAIRRANGEMLFNPGADSVLAEGDTLIAMGTTEQLSELDSFLNQET